MYKTLLFSAILTGNILIILSPNLYYTVFGSSNRTVLLHDSSFTIKGKIAGQTQGYIKMYYVDKNGKAVYDSAAIADGRFQLSGPIREPTWASLWGNVKSPAGDPNATSFFLEPTVINISLTFNQFKKAIITGSKTEEENKLLTKSMEPVQRQMKPLSKEYDKAVIAYRAAVKAKKNEITIQKLQDKLETIREKFEPYNRRTTKLQYDFFSRNPQSYVTAYNLRYYVSDLTLDSLKLFYDRLGPMQLTSAGKEIAKQIEQLQWGSPGSIAKDFSSKEINGTQLSLSEYKGKYVLLDFWASWCIPCRKGNPHLKTLYNKYKDKGVEFIGIADDDKSEDKWKEAVAKDGIGIWKHIRRGLKYENGEFDRSEDISDKFGIHTLPTKILIDKEGVIIGRFSEEEAPLDAMFKNIFGY